MLSDVQLGDKGVTLNHPVGDLWWNESNFKIYSSGSSLDLFYILEWISKLQSKCRGRVAQVIPKDGAASLSCK